MRRFQAVPYQDQSEINLSPMLDVVFIMLIFFIVVASFVNEQGLPVLLPSSPDRPSIVESIQVRVEPAGTFVVNNRAMTAASVQPYVQALYAESADAKFVVLVTEGSKVRDTAVAIEAGRSIGVDVTPIQMIEGL